MNSSYTKSLMRNFLCGFLSSVIWIIAGNTVNAEQDNSENLTDHPHETGWLFSVAPEGEILVPASEWRDDIFDYENVKQGDFSIMYSVNGNDDAGVFGFTPGQFIDSWDLNAEYAVTFWLRAEGEADRGTWDLYLVDRGQNRAAATLENVKPDGEWHQINIPVKNFRKNSGFDLGKIIALQLEIDLTSGSRIWFDDVRFLSVDDDQRDIGVSDKTIHQRMSEAEITRESRVTDAFKRVNENEPGENLNQYFSSLWLGEDLNEVNERLHYIFTTDNVDAIRNYSVHDDWSLHLNPMLIRIYYLFGSKSDFKPGRLEPRTEKALLNLLWKRMEKMNDIHLTNKSTWWMIGSENHDINSKVASLLSSQIFMNEPEYADRVYPNTGTGGASGYWFHQMYGGGLENKGPEGRGDWGDGRDYTAEDHYDAWVEFWNEYITERARKGFFLEVASTGYMRHTIGFLQNIYDFSDDPVLKKRMGMFLDLIWAEWAQDQLGAVRGGAKTRSRYHGYDSMWEAARYYLGGPGNADSWYSQLASDYDWPEIVWRMTLDRSGKGDYVYQSRKPGEEQPDLWPRPPGLERTMAVDTEARFLRYSWVTPDYILGTQMDHPAAVHSHLSTSSRWQGLSFATDFTASVSPTGIVTSDQENWQRERFSYYRSVQHENVLITQQNRRWIQQNPPWYPTYDIYERIFGIQFEGEYDRFIEQYGWIFLQHGNTYLAIRPLMGEYEYDHASWSRTGSDEELSTIREDTYDWGPNGQFIRFKDKYSPVIMEAGHPSDYSDLGEFQNHIITKRLELQKTVVPGWYIVVYGDGTEDSPQLYFNASNNEIPQINGEYIEYSPPFTFKSPYIYSEYNSGIISLEVNGMKEILDFKNP